MKLWNYIRWRMLMYPESTVSENDAVITYEELVI